MKYGLKAIILGVLFLAVESHAQLFAGWTTTVSAKSTSSSGATVHHSRFIREATFPDCNAQRITTANYYASLGYYDIQAPACSPTSLRIPELIVERPKIKWPWPGPVCLSCPLFNERFIELIYPEIFNEVTDLTRKFKIESYQKELLELQQRYNIERFEQELFRMEGELLKMRDAQR